MRIVRRASLIVGVVLVVTIVVGHLTRTSELERARDLQLVATAEVAATELAALVDTVSVAAGTGSDPDTVARSLTDAVPDHGVCAVSADTTRCAGDGRRPPDVLLADVEASRRDVDGPPRNRDARVSVYERRVTIVADGPELTVVVEVPVGADATVWPTTFLPAGATVSDQFVAGNTLQTAVPVPGAPGVYVVAAAEREVSLPAAERFVHLLGLALALVMLVVSGVTLLVEHRSLVERASLDRLTRLPNRSEFERRAEEVVAGDPAPSPGTGACLLLFDLDGFKQVNDTFGHLAGDELLEVVARRLRDSVRDGDLVARWGGDEFVVLLVGVSSAEMGARRARQIAESVAGRTRIAGVPQAIRVRTSVGVAVWPDHGRDLSELVVAADRAMYEAKRSGTVTRVGTATVGRSPDDRRGRREHPQTDQGGSTLAT